MARPMRTLVPTRASTQTWMLLTFVLFVGMAVLVIALYVGFFRARPHR